MLSYSIRRLVMLIPLIIGVTFIAFTAMYILPGDAVYSMLAEAGATAEEMEIMRERMGLNDPFYVQYGRFLAGLPRLDFGRSLHTRRPVRDQILAQYGASLELMAASIVIATSVGVTLGVIAALRRGSWADTGSMFFALLGVSVPVFWTGLLMIFFFSVRLGWLPSGGTGGVRRLVMPAVALSFGALGLQARVVRSSMLEILGSDYIRTARAKGLADRVVNMKHALRNALIPAITLAGLSLARLMGGSVIAETVFTRQGIGRMAAQAVIDQDFPVVTGTVTLMATAFLVINLIVDLSYALLDPRIRYS